jgi:selenide,water dikinase
MMKGELTALQYSTATDSMCRLNIYAADVLKNFDVSAMTDVTGFGLLGHLLPIARSSGLTAFIIEAAVPVLPDMEVLQEEFGTKGVCKVKEYVDEFLTVQEGVLPEKVSLFAEAETSGGLLVFIRPDQAEKALGRIRENGDKEAAVIGYAEKTQVKNEYLKVVRK